MGLTANRAFLPSFGFDKVIAYPDGSSDPPFQITFCFKAGGLPQSVQYEDFYDNTAIDTLADLDPSTGRWMPNAFIPKHTNDNQLIIDFLPYLLTGSDLTFTRAAGNPVVLADGGKSMYSFEINGCSKVSATSDAAGNSLMENLVSGSDTYTVSRAHYDGGQHTYGALIWATGTSGLSAPTTVTGSVGSKVFNVGNFVEHPVGLANTDKFLTGVSQVTAATMANAGVYNLMLGTNTLQSDQNTSRIKTLSYYEVGGTDPSGDYSFSVRAYYGTSVVGPR